MHNGFTASDERWKETKRFEDYKELCNIEKKTSGLIKK